MAAVVPTLQLEHEEEGTSISHLRQAFEQRASLIPPLSVSHLQQAFERRASLVRPPPSWPVLLDLELNLCPTWRSQRCRSAQQMLGRFSSYSIQGQM